MDKKITRERLPYMQNCGNCKFSERDECFEQLECKCPASDFCGDLVNEGFACHQWEMRAQTMD